MMKWDIWDLPQKIARSNTDPAQPVDKRRDTRPYLVISPDSYLSGSGAATCVPIQTTSKGSGFSSVGLDAISTGLAHDSFAICSQIVSVPQSSFGLKIGRVASTNLQDGIQSALRDYLELW